MEMNTQKLQNPNYLESIYGRTLFLQSISSDEISHTYLSWLNDENITRYLDFRNKKQSRASIISYVNSLRQKDECDLFAIFTKKSQTHIGNISIFESNRDLNYVGIGIMVGDYRSRELGLGAEALGIIIEYLFNNRYYARIEASSLRANRRSQKTLRSLGFVKEGELRRAAKLPNGEISYENVFGLLRTEWDVVRLKIINIIGDISVHYP